MTPKEYLDRYTYLRFFSPWNNALVSVPITGYGAGWEARGDQPNLGKQCQTEYLQFRRALNLAHHGNAHSVPPRFKFEQRPLGLIPTNEEFFPETFVHAFCGKGSPDEIIDTLRVAMVIGRIGAGARDFAGELPARPNPADYAKAFMTLDCNGLVGNYYRDDPQAEISTYASASRRRTSAAEVRVGDCIVTHSSTRPYEHVGLIQEWRANGSTATVRIVEWGWHGDESVHFTQPAQVSLSNGPVKSLGIGWSTISKRDGKPSFRYIFAPKKQGTEPYGWS